MLRPLRARLLPCTCAVLGASTLLACVGRSPTIADAGPVGPSLAFVGLAGRVGCDADAREDLDGFQLDVGVELLNDDDSGFAEVLLTNARNSASASAALGEGAAALTIEVVPQATPGADNTLTAATTNDGGRALTVSAVVTVECEVPPPSVTCQFTAPAASAVITTDHTEVSVSCEGVGLSAAARAWLGAAQVRIDATANADGAVSSQELDLVEGVAQGDVLLPGTGSITLTATVLDPDGLMDPDPTATVAIEVDTP